MVFYTIFSGMYLLELGIDDVGEDVDLRDGFALFYRESLGTVAMGIVFGSGLAIFLYLLNRRLKDEENVTQVVATIAVAYLT